MTAKASAAAVEKMSPEVETALATLEAAGIDTPEKFAEAIAEPEPPQLPNPTDVPEVVYARAVIEAALRLMVDRAGVELGYDQGQVDAIAWADALVHRLIDQGLTIPPDWAGRELGTALHDTYPPKEV